MNIYQKYTINSTKITVAHISSHYSTVQISLHLNMYRNLYEKDKLLKQEIMWEQDKPITHTYFIQYSWNFYHTSNITWVACHKNFTSFGALDLQLWKWQIQLALEPYCTNLFLPQNIETKTCNIIGLMHIEFHKDSKKSSFTILQFFYKLLWVFKVEHSNL